MDLTGASLGAFVHALHYAVLVGGVLVALILVAPGRPAGPRSAHDVRVATLRQAAAEGRLAEPAAGAGPPAPADRGRGGEGSTR